MNQLAVLISTFGYLGYFPFAPGTVGSAAGLALYLLTRTFAASWEPAVAVALFAAGVAVGRRVERHLGCVDPGPFILDEVMGMMLTLLLIPVGWGGLVIGFFLFRLFDIIKPYPARRLEALPGGLGMMADDAMAAIYANLVLRAAVWLLPAWLT
jgi:phosphatidylglycerophosphatase A